MATKKQPNLTIIFAQLDTSMVKAATQLELTTSTHDQVFELIMARLDAAIPHYIMLQNWWQSLPANPAAKAKSWAQANYAMRLLKQHVPQAPHVWVLVWAYYQTLQVFYATHASPEVALDKAMVALDQALNNYDNLQNGSWLNRIKTLIQQKVTPHDHAT